MSVPSETLPPDAPPSATAAQTYGFLCFLFLGVILLADLQGELGLLTALKILIGVLGVIGRLRAGAALLLVTLAIEPLIDSLRLVGMGWGRSLPARPFTLADVLLAAGVLGYALAHSRLLSLTVSAFPPEPRRRSAAGRAQHAKGPPRRSESLVTADEIGLMAVTVAAATLAGWGLWLLLSQRWSVLGLPPTLSRVMLVVWIAGLGGPVIAALLGHWRTRRMSAAEAELHLQDVLWRETRREQRRQNQWLAWSRLRGPNRPGDQP